MRLLAPPPGSSPVAPSTPPAAARPAWRCGARLRLVGVALALGLAASAPGQIQAAGEVEKARALAEQAADELDAGRLDRAIELLHQAEALYHAPTHLAMLGEALEAQGKLVEAAETYERLASEPIPAGAPKAFRAAQVTAAERLRALVSRIPSLLVRLRTRAPDARVTLDERPFDAGADTATRVNPGKYRLRVVAAGFRPWEREVELTRGGVLTVDVQLEAEAPAPGAAPTAPPSAPGAGAPPSTPGPGEPAGGLGWPVWVAFGLGGAGLAVGSVAGLLSLGQVSDLEAACPEQRCPPEREGDLSSARTLGTVSTIGFVVGAVGVGAGIVLFATAPPAGPAEDAGSVTATLGPGSLLLRGRF